MRYLFIDFETRLTAELRLSKMTTRSYCEQTDVTMVAWALDGEDIKFHLGVPDAGLLEYFREMAECDDVCVVAFNASFDLRVWHINLGLPYPKHFLCALELARLCWPNQPGGYSLDNLAVQLGLAYQKIKVDLETVQGQELAEYCKMDVAILREIFNRELVLAPPVELRICELSNRAKTLHFNIDQERVLQAVENMSRMAGTAALDVAKAFGDDPEVFKAFGWHGDKVPANAEEAMKLVPRSVKPHEIKNLLLSKLDIDFITDKKSTSLKKINPAEFANLPLPARLALTSTSDLRKAMSYRSGLTKFSGLPIVDCELSYWAAHTGRFASRNDGAKGLNLHNIAKHNVLIAEPFRKSFVLPEGWVWVRGDFANVEYRGEGLLTGCAFIEELFVKDPFADPYRAFGEWATGLSCDKNTPSGKALRQLFKVAVLGLGYMMGLKTWMTQLLMLLAKRDDKGNPEITIDDFIKLAAEKRWSRMSYDARKCVRDLGCHDIVGIVGEHVHELFHQRHPEFSKFGRWLEATVSRLSYAHDPAAVLEELYQLPGAPKRELLDLSVDRRLGGSSVRASTSGWPASVCWRDLAVRETGGRRGPCLTSILAGHKPPRAITPNILIENCVQYWARVALCMGSLQLEDLGWLYQLSVHDEIFILARDNRDDILRAKRDMLKVFGPGNSLGFGWAILIDPSAVTVSKSLWDNETWCKKEFWPRLEAGDSSVLKEVA